LATAYDFYTWDCPYCGHHRLIRWGYYFRQGLPMTGLIRIQRLRCKRCGRTTHLLPSFLLSRRRYHVKLLEHLLLVFIDDPCNWKQRLDIALDLSTAYRWLRALHRQALEAMPEIRKELVRLVPEDPIKDHPLEPVSSSFTVLERFLALSGRLFKAAVRLAEPEKSSKGNLFCFLNFFLAQQTEKALLMS
jgi:transposase-like protein